MQDDTLRTGICPKCGSKEVYSDKDKARHNERGCLKVSPGTGFTVDTYICIACGYFEEYFNESDLRDSKTLSKLKEKWTKI